MSQTLLEIAKDSLQKRPSRNKRMVITSEHVELALAWTEGTIGLMDVGKALGMRPELAAGSPVYVQLALFLREAVRRGNLKASPHKR